MEDIDQTIDLMNKQQLVTCVAKSSAKRRRQNVQYTTQNQRVSVERVEKIYETFEKLLRDIIKVWIRDEKTVRLKYLKPMTEERKSYLITDLNTELEPILKQISDCRINYKKMGELELFEKKFQETQTSIKIDVENKIGELFKEINTELASSKKIEPSELVKLYRIEEQTLIELRLIKPLQEINVAFYEMPDDFKSVADGIQNTITLCGKYYEKGALKNIVLTLETLMSYANLAKENLNLEVLEKNKERLIELLKLAPEEEERLQAIQPLMDWF
jgi:hypothetical protein